MYMFIHTMYTKTHIIHTVLYVHTIADSREEQEGGTYGLADDSESIYGKSTVVSERRYG